MDELDEATKTRIRRLSEAAPVLPVDWPLRREGMSSQRSTRINTAMPIGLASALIVGAVVLVSLGILSRPSTGGAGATPSSKETVLETKNPGAAGSTMTSPGTVVAGIQVTGVEAFLWPSGKYLTVTLTIRNSTNSTVKFVGVSSPTAALAGLYSTTDCASADKSELCEKRPIPFWRLAPGEVAQLRPGAGEIILGDFASPVAPGQTIEMTLQFDGYPPVTLNVVAAAWSAS